MKENTRILSNEGTKWGGGIRNFHPVSTETPLTIVKARVEISGNEAPLGGGVIEFPVAGVTVNMADTSIVTGNNPNNCQTAGNVPICVG